MPMKVRYTVMNGEIIAEKRNGVRKTYLPNPLGSTVALLDSSQAVTDMMQYWPNGEVATRTGTTATPFQFVGSRGYFRDSASRTYVRNRYYRQDLARWQTTDPIGFEGGDYNLYRYSAGNWTTNIDPDGLRHCHVGSYSNCVKYGRVARNCPAVPDGTKFNDCTGCKTKNCKPYTDKSFIIQIHMGSGWFVCRYKCTFVGQECLCC